MARGPGPCAMSTLLALRRGDLWLLLLCGVCQVPRCPGLWLPLGVCPYQSHAVTFSTRCPEPSLGPRTTQVSALLAHPLLP